MAYDKVVDSAVLDGYFSDIADAIRDKGGSGTYTPAEMPQAIEDLPSGGMEAGLSALMAGTASGSVTVNGLTDASMMRINIGRFDGFNPVTELHFPNLIRWASQTVSYLSKSGGLVDLTDASNASSSARLQVLDIPNCISLYAGNKNDSGSYVCFGSLTTINAPKLETLRCCFRGSAISAINFPKLTDFSGSNVFMGCPNLKTVRMPLVQNASGAASLFYDCTALEEVDFESLRYASSNMFRGCIKLTTVNAPLMTTLQSNMFQGCTSLEAITLPSAIFQNSYNFTDCTSLDFIDVGGTGGMIGTGTFRNCPLTALVIRSSSAMVTLSNTNAFQGTNIEAGTGYIYVPSALVSAYEAATNWSTYAGQFRAIENYTSDGTLTGDFVMPT